VPKPAAVSTSQAPGATPELRSATAFEIKVEKTGEQKLNTSSLAYVKENLPHLVENWDPAYVLSQCAEEVCGGENEGNKRAFETAFQSYSKLGTLRGMQEPSGGVGKSWRPGFDGIWAEYWVRSEFSGGARMRIHLVLKWADPTWEVLGFDLAPDA
jgi:hypothetical protein